MVIEIWIPSPPSKELLDTIQFMKELDARMMTQLAIPAEFFKEQPIDHARELRRFERAVYRLIGATSGPDPIFPTR